MPLNPTSHPMRTRPFGSTGIEVPEIGLGCWAFGGAEHGNSYGPTEDATSRAAIERALALGVEVFDTADVYGNGHSERVLGSALGDRGLVLTKAGWDFYSEGSGPHWHGHYLEEALARSLERLGRERVDLFQLHNPPEPLMRDPDLHQFLAGLKDTGSARWVGVSVHRMHECLTCAEAGPDVFDAVQVPFSVLRQDTLPGIHALSDAGIAVIAREPLANGFLTGKYDADATFGPADFRSNWPPAMVSQWSRASGEAIELFEKFGIEDPVAGALAFVLAHEVSVVIPGAKTPAHVEQNVGAATHDRLPAELLEALYQLEDAVR